LLPGVLRRRLQKNKDGKPSQCCNTKTEKQHHQDQHRQIWLGSRGFDFDRLTHDHTSSNTEFDCVHLGKASGFGKLPLGSERAWQPELNVQLTNSAYSNHVRGRLPTPVSLPRMHSNVLPALPKSWELLSRTAAARDKRGRWKEAGRCRGGKRRYWRPYRCLWRQSPRRLFGS
jgi:hypothetical protein